MAFSWCCSCHCKDSILGRKRGAGENVDSDEEIEVNNKLITKESKAAKARGQNPMDRPVAIHPQFIGVEKSAAPISSLAQPVPHTWASQEWDSLFLPPDAFKPSATVSQTVPTVYHTATGPMVSLPPAVNAVTSIAHHANPLSSLSPMASGTMTTNYQRTITSQNPLATALPFAVSRTQTIAASPSPAPHRAPVGSQVILPATASIGPVVPTGATLVSRPPGALQSVALSPLTSTTIGGNTFTASLAQNALGLPAAQTPGEVPFYNANFPGATLKQIKSALRKKPFILEKVFEREGATGFSTSVWQEGNLPGTFVRGLRFQMPLPKDMPASVQKLVKIPDSSRATVVVRLKETDSEVVMLYQTCTHDAPFGETFRVQDTMSFTQDAAGVKLSRWVEVAWVGSLPWGIGGVIKGAVESNVKQKSAQAQPRFVELLQEAMQ